MPITLRFNPERQQQASAAAFGVGMPITDGGLSAVAGGLNRVASAAGQIGARLEQKDNELEHRKLTDASSRREAELDSLVELRKEAFDNGEMQVLRDLNEKIAEFNPDSETYSKNLNTYVNSDKYSALRDESLELGDASFRERHAATFERGGVMSRSLESINQMEDDGDSILAPLEKAIKEDSASAGTVAAMEATFQSLMAHPTYANNPKKAEYLEARYNVGLIAAAESFNDRAAELPYEQAQAQAADIEKKIRASSINGPEKQKVLSRLDTITAPKGNNLFVTQELRRLGTSTEKAVANLGDQQWLNYSEETRAELEAIRDTPGLTQSLYDGATSHLALLDAVGDVQQEATRLWLKDATPAEIASRYEKYGAMTATHKRILSDFIQDSVNKFDTAGDSYLETAARNPKLGSYSFSEVYSEGNYRMGEVFRRIREGRPIPEKELKALQHSKNTMDSFLTSEENMAILGKEHISAEYDVPFVGAFVEALSADGDLSNARQYLDAWGEVNWVWNVTNWAAANISHPDEDIRQAAIIAMSSYRGVDQRDPTATPMMYDEVASQALLNEASVDEKYANNEDVPYSSEINSVQSYYSDPEVMPRMAERVGLTHQLSAGDDLYFYAVANALAKQGFEQGKRGEDLAAYVDLHIDNATDVIPMPNGGQMMLPTRYYRDSTVRKFFSGSVNRKRLGLRVMDEVSEGYRTAFSDVDMSTYEFQDRRGDNKLQKLFHETMRKFQNGEAHLEDVLNVQDKYGNPYAQISFAQKGKQEVIAVYVMEYNSRGEPVKRAPWKTASGVEAVLDAQPIIEKAIQSSGLTSGVERSIDESFKGFPDYTYGGI